MATVELIRQPFADTGPTSSGLIANTYTVTVTDLNNCTQSNTVTIINANGPGVTAATGVDVKCKGGNDGTASVTIAGGTGPYTYSWSSGTSTTTTSLTSIAAGLTATGYTVVITDGTGCTTSSTVTVSEPAAVVSASTTPANGNCGNLGSITATATGGNGTYTYMWSSGASTQTAIGLSTNIYTVTVTDWKNCSATSTAAVTVTPALLMAGATSTSTTCNGGTDGTASVSVSAGTSTYTYSWSSSLGASTSTITSSTTNALNTLPAAVYTVVVTDANGCSVSSTVTLQQPLALTASPTTVDAKCGNSNGSVAVVMSGGNGPTYTYSWSSNAGGSSSISIVTNLPSGTYSVTVSDSKGCTASTSATINSTNNPVANASSTQATITEGNSTVLNGSGGISYSWTPSASLSCNACPNPTASPDITTTYTLTVTDPFGCTDTADVTIKVKPACSDEKDIFIANVFSPNGDGLNDELFIEGNGISNIYWSIYDRWGNMIFESTDQSKGWDGTKNGTAMESGTYVYYLKALCIKSNKDIKLKGNVSIVK